MADYIGMDPDEVKAFAQQLQTKSGELQQIVSQLTSQLTNTTWVGADRTRFEGDWQGTIAVNLKNAADQLHEASTLATSNAEAQIATSA